MWELWGKLQMIQSLRKMHGALLAQEGFAEDQKSLRPCSKRLESALSNSFLQLPGLEPDGPLIAVLRM